MGRSCGSPPSCVGFISLNCSWVSGFCQFMGSGDGVSLTDSHVVDSSLRVQSIIRYGLGSSVEGRGVIIRVLACFVEVALPTGEEWVDRGVQ